MPDGAVIFLRQHGNPQGPRLVLSHCNGLSAVASDIRRLPCPTKVIGADPVVPLSFLPSVDLSDMVALDYDFVPETTHFLQLEEPQECVDRTLEFLMREQLA